ncbi:unnamed protein product [Heterobilharzia americana]|nr:unnamed protein product [Heterobilharzia americana]
MMLSRKILKTSLTNHPPQRSNTTKIIRLSYKYSPSFQLLIQCISGYKMHSKKDYAYILKLTLNSRCGILEGV